MRRPNSTWEGEESGWGRCEGGSCTPFEIQRSAVAFVRDFVRSGKPVGVICHGPWSLIEAGVAHGRTLTSFPSIRTDLRNAGANVVDQEVVIDGNLISSRSPDDLSAFCRTIVEQFTQAPAHAT
jgi:protease I